MKAEKKSHQHHTPTPKLFNINRKVKGPYPIVSISNVTTQQPPHTKPYQRRRVGGRDRRRYEDVRGSMRRCWQREEVKESQDPTVPRSRGPKVPGSQGPGYLKLTFKYELDSKEGPSCYGFQTKMVILEWKKTSP